LPCYPEIKLAERNGEMVGSANENRDSGHKDGSYAGEWVRCGDYKLRSSGKNEQEIIVDSMGYDDN
jgi:hypothetical protein